MRITSKGQVTIPADIRASAGLLPNTEVAFAFDGNIVTLTPAKPKKGLSRGEQIVAHLRRHKGDVKLTTDEIMAMTRGEE